MLKILLVSSALAFSAAAVAQENPGSPPVQEPSGQPAAAQENPGSLPGQEPSGQPAAAQENPGSQESPGSLAAKAPILASIPAISDDPAPPITEFVEGQAKGELLATDFIGLQVYGEGDTALGTIDDILFDEKGQLSVIVLNVSDLLGSEKRVAFALSSLRREANAETVRLVAGLNRDSVTNAPDFTSLSKEMSLDDGQSLTAEEAEGGTSGTPPN